MKRYQLFLAVGIIKYKTVTASKGIVVSLFYLTTVECHILLGHFC